MNARERLLNVLRGDVEECYCGNPHCSPPEVLLDAYAHELAERIRAELPERVEKLTGDWAEIRTVSTAQHAADLIDPEVER